MMPLPQILHVDDWLVVVNKPAGLLSVTGRGPAGADCVHARVQARWPDALVVHRLDMATSGLMVFGRGAEAQRRLSQAFAQRRVRKDYVAIVAGRARAAATDEEGWATIDLPLIADWPARPRQKVDHDIGRPSLTHWRPDHDADGRWGEGTRVLLRPVTGRSHQLRVHLATIGHPIVGDELYAPPAVAECSPRLLLHAERLALPHPANGCQTAWDCPATF